MRRLGATLLARCNHQRFSRSAQPGAHEHLVYRFVGHDLGVQPVLLVPMIITDIILPSFMCNKIPTIHFIEEKKSEAKLRRVLDETYAVALRAGRLSREDAIARTF